LSQVSASPAFPHMARPDYLWRNAFGPPLTRRRQRWLAPYNGPMRTRFLRLLVVFGLAAGLLGAPNAFGAPVRVKATARSTWNPAFVRVAPGTRVVWVNPARHGTTHNLTAYGSNWSKRVTLGPGERTGKGFRRTGRYKYYCTIHGHRADGECHGMCGVVRVAR